MGSSVSIFGCGWLGVTLSQFLINEGYTVRGTVRSAAAQANLADKGIEAHHYDLGLGKIPKPLLDSDYWIFAIPFRRNLVVPDIYRQQCRHFAEEALSYRMPQKFIFTSSTLVYGSDNNWKKESSEEFLPDLRPQILKETETVFLDSFAEYAYIFRLAGLYGDGREVSGMRKKSTKSAGPINLISAVNASQAILYAIQHQLRHHIYNIVEPFHPDRKLLEFKNAGELPNSQIYKIVSSALFREESGLAFPSTIHLS